VKLIIINAHNDLAVERRAIFTMRLHVMQRSILL